MTKKVLTGTLEGFDGGGIVSFEVLNTSRNAACIEQIEFDPPVTSEARAVAHDVKIGRCSQMACCGEFDLSLLSRVGSLRDLAQPAMSMSFAVSTPVGVRFDKRRVKVTIAERSGAHVLMPFDERGYARSQMSGQVTKVLVTDELAKAIESGEAAVSLSTGMPVTREQDYEPEHTVDCALMAGLLMLKKPVSMSVTETFAVSVTGGFSPSHLLPVMEPRL